MAKGATRRTPVKKSASLNKRVTVKRSVKENDKSMRAVWVSIGSAAACTSPSVSSAGGEFCQPSITCTRG